jgi:3-phenylpropionate/trans-cinnamate dioxygenase ferredoxin subunit
VAKYVVAMVDELPLGQRKVVEIAGRSVGVFNIGGEYFALRNSCPHQGGPLCLGRLTGFLMSAQPGQYDYHRHGEILRCPWHGWEFDVKTGQSWVAPERVRVRTYPVSVEAATPNLAEADAEAGLVKGPYVAESYPVTVEQQFVVVEIP